MRLSKELLQKLIDFRKQLHRFPELSGCEEQTAMAITDFVKPTNPSHIIENLGGHGVAFVYHFNAPGPTLLLRADTDALPIREVNNFEHSSSVYGVAHLCGHDGHTAILVGVAHVLGEIAPKKGQLVLLFQPAEETGKGAAAVINDPKFQQLKPNFSFALHNLPGYDKKQVFVRNGIFASASTGVEISLQGKPSHAAHPEQGNNPDRALAALINRLNSLTEGENTFTGLALLTIVHVKLGEVTFGTTPGDAIVLVTLRAHTDSDLQKLKQQVQKSVVRISSEFELNHSINFVEEFPATVNHPDCVELVTVAAQNAGLTVNTLENPFRWSEDFGHFAQLCPSALFGVGAGTDHPGLHNNHYDFPDEIIEPSVQVLLQIVKKLLG